MERTSGLAEPNHQGVRDDPDQTAHSRLLARLAARAASAKQAERVVVLDVRDLITITDYFVVCSGTSERQVSTISEEVEKALREEAGVKPFRREGESGGHWLLLDYVDIVVHVFHEEERDFYRLETLWGDAPRLDWESASEEAS